MTDYRIAALCETREARELFALIASEAKAERPRAIAASGLPVPLLSLLVREGCRVLAPDHPAVVFAPDTATAARLAGELQADGLRAAAYLPREYVLYHVTASHEAERARLAVLSALCFIGRSSCTQVHCGLAVFFACVYKNLTACCFLFGK